MVVISYAQNFEDVILSRALSGVRKGFYVDVGAWDPCEHSVTYAFYQKGWRGINIEPNREYFGRLVTARPRDVNLGIAVGETDGSALSPTCGKPIVRLALSRIRQRTTRTAMPPQYTATAISIRSSRAPLRVDAKSAGFTRDAANQNNKTPKINPTLARKKCFHNTGCRTWSGAARW
jgi:hypothetical protein